VYRSIRPPIAQWHLVATRLGKQSPPTPTLRLNLTHEMAFRADTLTDCDWGAHFNAGCGVSTNKAKSYGPDFNAAGGGIYAMERTPTEIKVWFWPRKVHFMSLFPVSIPFFRLLTNVQDDSAPLEVVAPRSNVIETSKWGTPIARFTNSKCDIASKFGLENVIINLTFCAYLLHQIL